jgi:hypothetical protein
VPENVPVRPKDEAEVVATAKAPKKAKPEPVAVAAELVAEEPKPRKRTPKKGD